MPTPAPAPDLETLLDFDAQISAAAKAVLIACSVAPASHSMAEAPTELEDDALRVKFERGAATGAQVLIPCGPLAGRPEYAQFTGTLTAHISKPFVDTELLSGSEIRTTLTQPATRASLALLYSRQPFTAENLPYLSVTDILPQGIRYYTNGANVLIEVSWNLTFEIRMSAWPLT